MSNSFSPKKAPNILNQETLERVLSALRQPFSIAVLASVGLHGLLWAALPNMLAETEKELDTKRRVQVVELSPAEQGQLPSLGLNEVPSTLLPTTPTKPAQSNTKLPNPKLYNDPSLYNFPLIQPPPPDVFPSFGLPPTTFDFNPPPAKKPQKPAPKPTTPPKPPTDSETAGKPDKDSPKTPVDPNAPVRPEKLSPEQIAALQEDAKRSRQLQALYTFNGKEIDDGEPIAAIGKIPTKRAEAFEDAVSKATAGNYDKSNYWSAPKKVEIPFPKEACSVMKEKFLKGAKIASIAASFDFDGKLVGTPGFLLNSGFNGLDQLAFNYVNGVTLKPSDKPRIVRFDFIFDPRPVCSKPPKDA